MAYLASQKELATGVEAIDHDHLQLLETINETCATLMRNSARDPVLDALGSLYVRICAHFALEEKMIRDSSPALYTAHKMKYEALLERIGVIMDAFYDGECDGCDKSLKDCLLSWLEQHLQTEHPRQHVAEA